MSIFRIIDANANRAREALRVMEEAARFVLDDADLTAALKSLRHELTATVAAFGPVESARDTPGDVGTKLTADTEGARASIAEVARAAGKRLGEALRAIEEYGKVIDAVASARTERLRYAGYDLAMRLDRALATGRARQWSVCVIVTAALCPDGDWERVAEASIRAGADCIQLREKDLDAGELLRRARRLVALAARRADVVVNDRPDVALAAGADGVHLGQADLPCADARRLVGERLAIGVSTSCVEEARAARVAGADCCGVGPMFPTATKRKAVIAGPAYLRAYLAACPLPHLAIGGVTPDNIDRLVEAGARGVAVSSAVCGAADPGATVAGLAARLRTARADPAGERLGAETAASSPESA